MSTHDSAAVAVLTSPRQQDMHAGGEAETHQPKLGCRDDKQREREREMHPQEMRRHAIQSAAHQQNVRSDGENHRQGFHPRNSPHKP